MTNLTGNDHVATVLAEHEQQLLNDWIAEQLSADSRRGDLIRERELRQDSAEFFRLLREAAQQGFSMKDRKSVV